MSGAPDITVSEISIDALAQERGLTYIQSVNVHTQIIQQYTAEIGQYVLSLSLLKQRY